MTDKEYHPASGPMGAKLMILGDSPYDLKTYNRELDRLLKDAGISRSNCWISTVSKYPVWPEGGKKGEKVPFSIRANKQGIDLVEQLEDLQNEVNSIKPNCILALGGPSLWALGGKDKKIGSFRGSILQGMGVKYVSTYNPRDLSFNSGGSTIEFKGYWNRQIMLFDFKRALEQSKFAEINRPNRTLEICRNSHQLQEFLDRYKNHKKVSIDIESGGSGLPICIGIAFNKHHGMTVPLWNADGISSIPDSDLIQCWILIQYVLNSFDVIGQNFNYDRDKILRLGFTVNRIISDTMYKAFAINPELPKGLAFNTSIYTEEAFYKDDGMYHGPIENLLIGCAKDACITYEVDENQELDLIEIGQKSFFDNYLMKLPDMYWDIERQGFNVDTIARDRLLFKYIEWDERLRYRLFQLTGTEINVNSPKQVQILLFDNFGLPRKSSTGEEAITELLNSPTAIKSDDVRECCELILEDRRVRKSISTYLMAMPDFDGRMRTTYFPCLETGRSSTGQQDPPIRPEIEVYDEKGKKKQKVLGIAFQTMTKHGDIGADIREMYVPDSEEEVFVQADSSQAEARVVWLLADDEEALRLVDEIDYHAQTATWFFGGTEKDYSKKVLGYEHPIRFAGKTLRHAGHLGAGKRRASIEVNTQARKYKIPIHISESVAERALKIFHSKQPKIQGVFQNLVIECLKRNRTLIAPIPYGLDVDFGGRRVFFERWSEELYRQGFSYIPQRTVTDNTKAAGLRIRARCPGIKIVMEAHDALLFCIPKSKLAEWIPIIKEEFERPIDFSRCSIPRRSLSIPCDIETGINYCDLKKFKDIPIIQLPSVELPVRAKSITEEFTIIDLPKDSKLTNLIYDQQMRDK